MKFRVAALVSSALLASSVSFAGVVTGSSNIDFLAIDGQKADKSVLKQKRSFTIDEKQTHQVVVRVSEIVRAGSDRVLFESDPIVITFQGSSEDVVISAPRLDTESAAERFKKAPVVTVKTASGSELSTKQEYLKQEGFFPSMNIIETLSDYNASGSVASVKAFATSAMPAALPGFAGKVAKGKIVVQGENVSEQMLQYWFQQADKETQQRFLNWAHKLK